jgi:hypothetical protein
MLDTDRLSAFITHQKLIEKSCLPLQGTRFITHGNVNGWTPSGGMQHASTWKPFCLQVGNAKVHVRMDYESSVFIF